jgi:hypothetical protein
MEIIFLYIDNSNGGQVTASSSGAKFECFSSPFDLLYLSIGNL